MSPAVLLAVAALLPFAVAADDSSSPEVCTSPEMCEAGQAAADEEVAFLQTMTHTHAISRQAQGRRVSKPMSQAEKTEYTQAHNIYRCMHGADPVVWDSAVAASAEAYVAPLKNMKHSDSYGVAPPAGPAGENIYWSSATSISPMSVVGNWYSEVNNCK